MSKFQCDRSREVPQILSTFKFIDDSVLSIDNFKKIRDFAEINDISKNPNRDFVIVSGFEVESYGDHKPFDIISIEGFFGGTYYKYSFSVDNDNTRRILRVPNGYGIFIDSYVDSSENDVANRGKIVKSVLDGIDNQKLSEINDWETHKNDYGFEFKYPQKHTPLRDKEVDDIELKLVSADTGERNIKIANSPNDPNPNGKFFQSEMPYIRIKIIKGIYGSESWLSTRKNEYFPDERDIKNQRKIDIDGKEAVELIGPGGLDSLYRVIIIQRKENLIVITQDMQTDMFDTILSTFKFTD